MDEAIQPLALWRQRLQQALSPEARRLLTGAAAVSVLTGVGAAFLLVPDIMPPPAVSHRAIRPAPAATVSNPQLQLTVPPVLRTPFTATHETRLAQAPLPPEGSATAKEPEKRPTAPSKAPPRPRLTGIVASGSQTMALIGRGGQTLALVPGESRDGVTLLEIRDGWARVRDENGEYELWLPGREEATGQ